MSKQNQESLEPVRESHRITALDGLRGFAVLGILIINIQSFSMVGAAYFNPVVLGDLSGSDYWVWLLSHTLADQKFMSIFSMLFGAGIVLMWQRAEEGGRKFLGVHFRRMGWLIVFGLLHAYLLWYGDILFLYGVCGLVVVWFRRLRPWGMILLGVLTMSIASLLSLSGGLTMEYWPQEDVDEMTQTMWQPPPEVLETEIRGYQGGWLDQMEHRVPSAVGMHTWAFPFWGFWRASGIMLIGMALFKMRIFDASRSKFSYLGMIAGALVVGIPTVLYGVSWNFENGWPLASFFIGQQFNYWASLIVALGWIGAVMLLFKSALLPSFTGRLGSVGRMALTCYLLQTIICTTIFYGHGLGLFGKVNRVEQILVVLAVWVFLLICAPIWQRRFYYGPFEWTWRCLSYWRIFPLKKA
jgi:uncharacterized protein